MARIPIISDECLVSWWDRVGRGHVRHRLRGRRSSAAEQSSHGGWGFRRLELDGAALEDATAVVDAVEHVAMRRPRRQLAAQLGAHHVPVHRLGNAYRWSPPRGIGEEPPRSGVAVVVEDVVGHG
jgi:hypothetical protein